MYLILLDHKLLYYLKFYSSDFSNTLKIEEIYYYCFIDSFGWTDLSEADPPMITYTLILSKDDIEFQLPIEINKELINQDTTDDRILYLGQRLSRTLYVFI